MAPEKSNNDKILQMIDMIHSENIRQGGKLDTLLSEVSSIKTQVVLLPCAERKTEIEEIKKDVKENTYSRIRLGGYIAGVSAVIVFVVQYIVPLLL